eukprot:80567_1
MDIFTTNGYCTDFEFVCTDTVFNACLMTNSKVICTTNTGNEYGVDSLSYCNMQQTAQDEWICNDYLSSTCNNLCTGTDAPITAYPTTSIPTTGAPTTPKPTTSPTTSAPTTWQPTTSEPTTLPTTMMPSSTSLSDREQRETILTQIVVSDSEIEFNVDDKHDIISIIIICSVISIICIVILIGIIFWKYKNKEKGTTNLEHVSDTITSDWNQMEKTQSNSCDKTGVKTGEKVVELTSNITSGISQMITADDDGDIETEQLYVEQTKTPGIDVVTTGGEMETPDNITDDMNTNENNNNNGNESECSEKLYDQINTTKC